MLQKILSKTLNLLFPETCHLCKRTLGEKEVLFCKDCFHKLPLAKSYCRRCGTLLSEELLKHFPEGHFNFCGRCLKDTPPFEKVFIGFKYESPIKELILQAKFQEDFVMAYQLGKLLNRVIKLNPKEYDLILPLPLSTERERERGFNQSLLLLWGFLEKPFLSMKNPIKRVRNTRPQSELSYKERLSNVKGAFEAEEMVKGKRILLLDDVMTTGATLHEATLALKKKGAKEVHLLLLARA